MWKTKSKYGKKEASCSHSVVAIAIAAAAAAVAVIVFVGFFFVAVLLKFGGEYAKTKNEAILQ